MTSSAAAPLLSDPLRRLGLGTAQFGHAYGISNTVGQVPLDDVRAILARAGQAGVGLLDTAANYGKAEQVLGQCDTKPFRLVSKTISVRGGIPAVIARARQSAQVLGRLDALLVHTVTDLLGPDGDGLWRALRDLKEEGVTQAIGISAYVANDPVALARCFRPDVMQVPFSLLDQRLLHDGSLMRLKDLGVEIHARSLFLQGLLFMAQPPDRLKDAVPLLKAVRDRIAAARSTPLAVAVSFVLSRPEVDVAVVGVTCGRELEEILAAAAKGLPAHDWAACALSDERILTPSRW
jgi:aryl-alcohol dehydrogenase-like predicted oxidoreductase